MLPVKERQIDNLAGMCAAIWQTQPHPAANPVAGPGKAGIADAKAERWRGNAGCYVTDDSLTIQYLTA